MKQKHSILIGGTKGVGRELAALLASDGQHVTVVGRHATAEATLSGGGRVIGQVGDLEEPEALLDALLGVVARRGALSSLVFLQRYRGQGDAWEGELTVSLRATRCLLEGLSGTFDTGGDRSVVMVSSNAATFVTRNQPAGYHVAKAALRQLARYYAVQLGPRGIRVNVVSPSAFVKPESSAFYESRQDLRDLYARITPLGRMGTAREVAQVAAYLLSPRASFVTGQELIVDGGMSLLLQDALGRELTGLPG